MVKPFSFYINDLMVVIYAQTRTEAEKKFSEAMNKHNAEVKTDTIDEFYNRLLDNKNEINSSNYPWNYIELVAREMTRQLKEKDNNTEQEEKEEKELIEEIKIKPSPHINNFTHPFVCMCDMDREMAALTSKKDETQEKLKTCGRCKYDGKYDGLYCHLCKRNPDDHRIDRWEANVK